MTRPIALLTLVALLAAAKPAPAPTVSTGGRIVYTKSGALHVYTVATHADVSLGVSGVNPKFSCDNPSSLIVYQSGTSVRIVNSNGTGDRLLAATGGVPSFNCSGGASTQVVFHNNGLWKINVDGSGLTQLTTDGGRQGAFSPDGSLIAYNNAVGSSGQQLFLAPATGGNGAQALTSAPIRDTVWLYTSKILFGMSVGGSDQVTTFDPATSAVTTLTTFSGPNNEPSWSPDGTSISFSHGSKGGIWVMNADGTGQQALISGGRQSSWGN